jgi:hypothetical protein
MSPALQSLARPQLTRLCTRGRSLSSILAPHAAPRSAAAASAAPLRPPLQLVPHRCQQQHRQRQATALRAFSGGAAAMPLKYREPIVIRPQEKHTATVIMLREWLAWDALDSAAFAAVGLGRPASRSQSDGCMTPELR